MAAEYSFEDEPDEIIPPEPRRHSRANGSTPPDPKLLTDAKTDAPKKKTRMSKADKISQMQKNIFGMHAILAMTSGLPFLAMSEQGAAVLAEPAYEVAAKYGLTGGMPVEVNLLFAMGLVYWPMLQAFNVWAAHRKAEMAKQAEEAASGISTDVSRETPADALH